MGEAPTESLRDIRPDQLFAREIAVFERLLPQLLETDLGRWVLIKEERFVDAYDTRPDAVADGFREFGNDAFFTRQILPDQPVLNLPVVH